MLLTTKGVHSADDDWLTVAVTFGTEKRKFGVVINRKVQVPTSIIRRSVVQTKSILRAVAYNWQSFPGLHTHHPRCESHGVSILYGTVTVSARNTPSTPVCARLQKIGSHYGSF